MEQYLIDKIKSAADSHIHEIVGSYVSLSRNGINGYVCVCPFHSDTNPSLHVSASKKVWKCFSCGIGGDCLQFVKKIENIGFIQALEMVARRYGIDTGITSINAKTMPSAPRPIPQPKEVIIGEYDPQVLRSSLKYKGRLFDYLCGIFGEMQVRLIWGKYCVGGTKDGREVFWYIDAENRIRYAKEIDYKSDGHRNHATGSICALHLRYIKALKESGKIPQDLNLTFSPSIFGAHLVNQEGNEKKIVCIVESEKTALLGSIIMPDEIWLAVGGKSYLNTDRLQFLKGRKIVAFADVDAIPEWSQKVENLRASGFHIGLVEWWKDIEDIGEKWDIADYWQTLFTSKKSTENG